MNVWLDGEEFFSPPENMEIGTNGLFESLFVRQDVISVCGMGFELDTKNGTRRNG